ncbi:MFS transporter [Brevibacterium rongguiense]|nr:MFS transporter [Brevibacterium rongguiense]
MSTDQQVAMKRPEEDPRSTWDIVKSIMAASSGNLVEWFDFYIYSFFSVYFAKQFFTGSSEVQQFMDAAAILFVGFLMRPIGGYIFGRLSDRIGRKRSMLISILSMCGGSLLMAILPTANTVGVLAPILLLLVRCIQGISVGGEYGSTATYMSEVSSKGKRGFFSSFQYVTLIGGQLLASVTAVIMTHTLGDEQISNGWWRLPFVIGAAAALVSLWLRSGLEETTTEETRSHKESGSFREVLRHPRSIMIVLGITSIGSLSFYIFTTYMQKNLVVAGFTKGSAADTMTVCLLVLIVLQPLMGMLSDQIGRKTTIITFAVSMMVLPFLVLTAIRQQPGLNPLTATCLILFAMVFLSFYTSISGVVKAEVFPAHVRGLGVGFVYAIGNSLFGGSAEYVGLWFTNMKIAWVFPIYVFVIAVFGLITMLYMYDDRKHSTLDFPGDTSYARTKADFVEAKHDAQEARAKGQPTGE